MRSSSASRYSLVLTCAALGVLAVSMMVLAGNLGLQAAAPEQAAGSQAKSKDQELRRDPRLVHTWRFERRGWIFVHLEGDSQQMGYQHGYLLAHEIEDAFKAVKFHDTYRTKRDWEFYRKVAREILMPKIDMEYLQELMGIVSGVQARGVSMDIFDVIALNAFEEIPDYYVPWLDKQEKRAGAPKLVAPGNCSAFVAIGSYTLEGRPVIAHNNWTSFIPGARWRVVFDIYPKQGNRILMDGYPGVITSDDDFAVTEAGLAVTETTITGFHGFDPNGIPEFVRSRKALQYATNIDEFVKIMNEGNNGGYANDWLLVDNNKKEIARFEQGLKNTRLWRTKDGYFVGSNFPSDPKLIKEETDFDEHDKSSSPNARRARWEQLMEQYKGKIDTTLAEKFLGDHFDTYQKKEEPNERTLCGHVEDSPRGIKEWGWGPYHPGGAVQGKVADGNMIRTMSMIARVGHSCGTDFIAADFLKKHPEYGWQKPALIDMKSDDWTTFNASDRN